MARRTLTNAVNLLDGGSNQRTSDTGSFVSVIMPVLNEECTIRHAIESVLSQTYPLSRLEILVIDGGSTDNTCNIVRELMGRYERIELIEGEKLNCPTAMNVGIQHSHGDFVAKVDGHGYLDRDFIEKAVGILCSDICIACVGGTIVAAALNSSIQKSNAYARFSCFGVGRGCYTLSAQPQITSSVQCGVYRKSALVTVGCFDPNLQFGEDEELNWRIIATGRKILYHPQLRFHYEVRKSFAAIFIQYFNYGQARVKVIKKHHDYIKWKHCLPPALVVALLAYPLTQLLFPEKLHMGPSWGFLVMYIVGLIFAATLIGLKKRYINIAYLCCSLACIHMGYGLGFIKGLINRV